MNTIPLTYNEKQINRTIIGEKDGLPPKIPMSVILLNRSGSTFRINNIESLLRLGFSDIVSIEAPQTNYNIDELSKKFPHVRFIIPSENLSPGDMINLGMQEVDNNKVLVIWDTMHIATKTITERLLKLLLQDDILCSVPFLFTDQMQNLPAKNVPTMEDGSFVVKSYSVVQDFSKTLYPFDFVGVYDLQKFINLGGFDHTITSSYWQLLDFALRANLWGEKITVCSSFRINYECELELEDTTPNESYLRFYLKNLCPKFVGDYAYIPKNLFFSYLSRSALGFWDAFKSFKMARGWVEKNKFRFKTDAQKLISTWEEESDEN